MSRFRNIVILLLVLMPTSSFAVTAGVEDAKSIARLYTAAFDRAPDIGGLNFWIDAYETGSSLVDIAGGFYKSPEFTTKYGMLNDQQYVEQLYQNVLGRPGEQGGVDFWTGRLSDGTSRASILVGFANARETAAKTAPMFADMRVSDCQWLFGPGQPDSGNPGCITITPLDGVAYDGLGYQTEFDRQYRKLEGISTYEFGQRYAGGASNYLAGISWDVRTAEFWDELQSDVTHHQLNQEEVDIIRNNGFVVSERQSGPSFVDVYHDIFTEDLPVFITTDSILHAWHRSYDGILKQFEEDLISGAVANTLHALSDKVPEIWERNSIGEYRAAIEDIDLYLTVARSLLAGASVPSRLGRDSEVKSILDAIAKEQTREITLFGEQRLEIFSQYKPRGHYTESETLKRYFRAMMWLGRTDLDVAEVTDGDQPAYTLRQLLSGVVLYDLLRTAQQFDSLNRIDEFLQLFVGQADSMTFSQFGTLLRENGIESLQDLATMGDVRNLQEKILQSDWGVQQIQARPFAAPAQSGVTQLPRSLTFLGQRFAVDSWIVEMTTHSYWDSRRNNSRYIPSGLDVAFAVLGNSQVAPRLQQRMENSAGVSWRDGIEYQGLLAAGREVIDSQSQAAWQGSIYNLWLYALRALSEPTTDERFPEAMRTAAWASKTLNTQLASWTELRHDAILYDKQSGGGNGCYYPEGFVEPRIEFWRSLEHLARSSAQGIANLAGADGLGNPESMDTQYPVEFLNRFADTVAELGDIAEKQLSQQELTEEERWYLENVVEIVGSYNGWLMTNGWYPELFYEGLPESGSEDPLVADIQSVIPTEDGTYAGHVLNEATGAVNLMAIAIENGSDRVVYLGPVMSHYEFLTPHDQRMNDEQWKSKLGAGAVPPRNEWVLDYLVPVR